MNPNVERLQDYAAEGLGLSRGEVRLEPHRPKWKRLFSDEAYFVYDHLRDESLRFYHVGSTAVPDLAAKPVLDILGSVRSLKELDRNQDRLESIGYECMGEYGLPGRRYFVLQNADQSQTFVHLHIYEHGHPDIERHLGFRNILRQSSDAKSRYGDEKRKLIEGGVSRADYSEKKSTVIRELESETKNASKASANSKVLAVVGSAEGHERTLRFVCESFQGRDLEVVDLSSSRVLGFSYRGPAEDAFIATIEKAIAADLLVLATPVYWYSMSGPMKDFIDRFSNLMNGPNKKLGETLYGKRVMLLSTGYDLTPPLGFETPFSATSIYFGMDYMGCTYRSTRS